MPPEIAAWTALLTSGVAVLVAVVTQVSTWRLESRKRDYERRRLVLIEMQDQAMEVRDALVAYGRQLGATTPTAALAPGQPVSGQRAPTEGLVVTVPEDPELVRARSRAEALLDVRISRLEDPPVRVAVEAWLPIARSALLSPDDDVTPAQEKAAWEHLCDEVARALLSVKPLKDGRLPGP